MYFQLAFPIRYTLKKNKEGIEKGRRLIKKHNGMTAVYRSIYDFDGLPSNDTAIIDKLFFDFDPDPKTPGKEYLDLIKLHEYLEDYEHSVFFSGRGFHLFLKTEKALSREFMNPSYAIKSAHNTISKKAKVSPDENTKDILRIARIPNTLNLKTNLFCIPLSEEDIYSSFSEIKEKAKQQHFDKHIFSGKKIDLKNFDGLAKIEIEKQELPSSDISGDLIFEELPKCMVKSLLNGDCGYEERYALIVALRDLCYSKRDVKQILKKYLTERKYKHCVFSERQVDYLFGREDLIFPSCIKIKNLGFCVEGCCGHDLYL